MFKKLLFVSVMALMVLAGKQSIAHELNHGYWFDSAGKLVHTGSGTCWRTGSWTSELAIAECEGGKAPKVMPKKAMPKEIVKTAPVDSDKDGIMDANDQCPGTEKGIVVNKQGCELEENIDLSNVQFETGTAILSSSSISILDSASDVLIRNSHLNFEVAGHTDSAGNYQSNMALSKSRAAAVRDYLVNKGVAADRLNAKGYGSDKPAASNDTREGRRANRRVELNLK